MALGDDDITDPNYKTNAWKVGWGFRAAGGMFFASFLYALVTFGVRGVIALDPFPSSVALAFAVSVAHYFTSMAFLVVNGGFVFLSMAIGLYLGGALWYYVVGRWVYEDRVKNIHENSSKFFRRLHPLTLFYFLLGSFGIFMGALVAGWLLKSLGGADADTALGAMVPKVHSTVGVTFLAETIGCFVVGFVAFLHYMLDMQPLKLIQMPIVVAGTLLVTTILLNLFSGAAFGYEIWFWGKLGRCAATASAIPCFLENETAWWQFLGSIFGYFLAAVAAYIPLLFFDREAIKAMGSNSQFVGNNVDEDQDTIYASQELTQRRTGGVDHAKLGDSMF